MEIKGVENEVPYSGINSLTTFLCGARFIETQLSSCGPISNIDTLARAWMCKVREKERERGNKTRWFVNDIYIYIYRRIVNMIRAHPRFACYKSILHREPIKRDA